MLSFHRLTTLSACAAFVFSCAEASAQFDIQRAPEYSPPKTISMFGIFRGGRMTEQAWEAMGSRLSAPFHSDLCEVGYGPELRAANSALIASVDQTARDEGISDELLEKVASHAQGELVMILMLYTFIPVLPSHDGGASMAPAAPAQQQMGSRGRGMGGGGGQSSFSPSQPQAESRAFEISASLFSAKLHHLVAQIDMKYSGSDVAEAMKSFNEKIRTLAPGATCVGWKW